jgi:signal peptidase
MLLLAVVIVAFRILGYKFFTVETGSMTEVYPVGTVIVVKPSAFEEIQLNDVITFYANSTKDTVVTHRVVAIDSEYQSFTTQGDENDSPDSSPVLYSSVIGKPILSIKHLGYVYIFMSTTKGKWVFGGLFVSAIAISFCPQFNRKELKEYAKEEDES